MKLSPHLLVRVRRKEISDPRAVEIEEQLVLRRRLDVLDLNYKTISLNRQYRRSARAISSIDPIPQHSATIGSGPENFRDRLGAVDDVSVESTDR